MKFDFLRLSNTKVGITKSLSKYAKMVKLGMMFNLSVVQPGLTNHPAVRPPETFQVYWPLHN